MFSKIYSAHPLGVNAIIVTVESHIESQVPNFIIVGLPDNAVKESRERVSAAIKNSDLAFPPKRITINLAPADFRKEGSAFDLPIALSILNGLQIFDHLPFENALFLGELSLDGKIKAVKGVLPMIMEAQKKGFKDIYLPRENANEACLIPNLNIYPLESLKQLVDHFQGLSSIKIYETASNGIETDICYSADFCDVKGQYKAKRAMEIAATGGHNLIMMGPPGSGKTMLARRLPSILPPMTEAETLETTKIYSVSGKLDHRHGLVKERPFRSPHHTISDIALIGGGRGIPMPGEVSLAHNGVLFLDELPEFNKRALEVLRQPMEDKVVTISRTAASLTFPAQFMLVAALNPSPKGYGQENAKNIYVSESDIQKYLSRLSGPLLDRIDIHIEVPALPIAELSKSSESESSQLIRERVINARKIQLDRFKKHPGIYSNSGMSSKELKLYCYCDASAKKLLETAIQRLGLSARAYDRILKVSRSIADLDISEKIESHHIAEAVQYRSLDKQFGI